MNQRADLHLSLYRRWRCVAVVISLITTCIVLLLYSQVSIELRKLRMDANLLAQLVNRHHMLNLIEKQRLANHDNVTRQPLDTHEFTVQQNHPMNPLNENTRIKTQEYLITTPTCRIPKTHSHSPDIDRFFKSKMKEPKCDQLSAPLVDKLKQRGPPLVNSNLTALWIENSMLRHYGVSNASNLHCCFRPFSRLEQNPLNYNKDADNKVTYSKKCVKIPVDKPVTMANEVEYVRVECIVNEGNKQRRPLYRDFHNFVPRKPQVEERCLRAISGTNNSNNGYKFSVLILGIDSMSRLNMERQMVRTRTRLLTPPLSVISLLGYNKVGENTFPNVVPLLTGLLDSELRKQCWEEMNTKLDDCPFIWKDFANAGYRTIFDEDYVSISTFNYLKTGFVTQPTDYYPRPLQQESMRQQGHQTLMGIKQCIGPRHSLQMILNTLQKFTQRFADEPYFAMFWINAISHNDLNMARLADHRFDDILKQLTESGALKNTILMFISDHGTRWGSFRQTYQGYLEERLPMAYFSLPETFRGLFPEAVVNFVDNTRRLTSPFDIYATLRDLLSLSNNSFLASAATNQSVTRGISLFSRIPINRTCQMAGINKNWCTCEMGYPVDVDATAVEQAVNFVINDINAKITKHAGDKCKQLKLFRIRNAKIFLSNSTTENDITHFLITVETIPGHGVFESVVTQNSNEEPKFVNNHTNRVNAYGSQSKCVQTYPAKIFCYCKD